LLHFFIADLVSNCELSGIRLLSMKLKG
jgi:hypothetical protein